MAVLAIDVNASQVHCSVQDGGVRMGLRYVKGLAEAQAHAIVAERDRGGPFRELGELAARVALRRPTLEQLAWSGACDSLMSGPAPLVERDRRTTLWQLGLATPAEGSPGGGDTQLALPLKLPAPPALRPLGRWQRLIADYSTSGVTYRRSRHRDPAPTAGREERRRPGHQRPALARLPSGGEVAVAGLVIARQRPGTANGTMFLLFEDEFGTINLIVPREVYERHRQLARAEPLLLARGRLERHHEPAALLHRRTAPPQGSRGLATREPAEEVRPVINVLVRELAPLERFLPGGLDAVEEQARGAHVRRLPGAEPTPPGAGDEGLEAAEVGSSMRAVAPPVQSFAAGRRR